jgi:hypothetical protein
MSLTASGCSVLMRLLDWRRSSTPEHEQTRQRRTKSIPTCQHPGCGVQTIRDEGMVTCAKRWRNWTPPTPSSAGWSAACSKARIRARKTLRTTLRKECFASLARLNGRPCRAMRRFKITMPQRARSRSRLTRISQCAPRARITSGGGFHPDSSRFDLVAGKRLGG